MGDRAAAGVGGAAREAPTQGVPARAQAPEEAAAGGAAGAALGEEEAGGAAVEAPRDGDRGARAAGERPPVLPLLDAMAHQAVATLLEVDPIAEAQALVGGVVGGVDPVGDVPPAGQVVGRLVGFVRRRLQLR